MSITLILGPMGSSKTTTLILAIKRFSQQKKSTIIIKHSGDTRYSVNNIIAHNKISHEAIVCTKLFELVNEVKNYDVIGIDEGQFYEDIYQFVIEWVNKGKIFVIAGLDGKENQEVFNHGLLDLIPHAEEVTKLKAVCNKCQADASFTKRRPEHHQIDDSGLYNADKMGGFEQYAVYCRICLNKLLIEN